MSATGFLDACGFTAVSSGTGDFVVSAAITGYQTPASAGAVNTTVYSYRAESADKSQWEQGFGAYTVAGTTLARTTITANSLGTTAKISFTNPPNVFITDASADLINASLLSTGTLPDARISDTIRQNILLDRIYLSKVFAGYRRLLNAFADGFKASDGIDVSSTNYVVTTASGNVAPSVGANSLISTSGKTPIGSMTAGGGLAAAFDSTTAQTAAASARTSPSVSGFNNTIGIDWGVGVTNTIAEFMVYGPSDNSILSGGSTTNLKLQGSPDNSTWTDLTGNIATGTANSTLVDQTTGITTTTAYRYHRVNISGNGTTAVNVAELRFFTAGTVNNMTLITTAQTADATVSNGRVLIEYDNTATPTLGTDLTAEVTCNGGTNWTAATQSSVSTNGQGGRKIAETVDQATTGGTSFAARIKTLNNKNVPIYGVSLTVH